MGKGKIAAIIIAALLVVTGIVAYALHMARPANDSTTPGNATTTYQSDNANANAENLRGKTSETTTSISNGNENTGNANGGNSSNVNANVTANQNSNSGTTGNQNGANRNTSAGNAGERVYETSAELGADGQRRDIELSNRDQQADQAVALNVLGVLRNYDSNSFDNWILKLTDVDFAAVSQDSDTKNILKREANNDWARGMASYPEVQNKVLDVEGVSEYMQPINGRDYPTVWVQTHEIVNEDWPMPGSDHWKPIDEVRREYLIVLDPDTRKVWRVKQMEQTVINADITGYNFPRPGEQGE